MVSARTLSLTSIYQLGSLLLACVLCAWLWPQKLDAVASGGALMALNFFALRYFLNKAIGGAKPQPIWALALAAKTVAMLALLALLMSIVDMDAVGIALGLFTLFIGMGLAVTHQAYSPAAKAAAGGAHLG